MVYIPPENSRFYKNEIMDDLVQEIFDMCSRFNKVYIMGDFNARTSDMVDYIASDSFLMGYFHIYNNSSVPVARTTQDHGRPNNHGFKLIDICKSNHLLIVNGRKGSDLGLGKCTSKEVSVVDYLLVSYDAFDSISKFEVFDFDPIMSDVHCGITFCIKPFLRDVLRPKTVTHRTLKWNEEKVDDFKSNIDTNKVQEIYDALIGVHNLTVERNNFINSIANKISQVFIESANSTFGFRRMLT